MLIVAERAWWEDDSTLKSNGVTPMATPYPGGIKTQT